MKTLSEDQSRTADNQTTGVPEGTHFKTERQNRITCSPNTCANDPQEPGDPREEHSMAALWELAVEPRHVWPCACPSSLGFCSSVLPAFLLLCPFKNSYKCCFCTHLPSTWFCVINIALRWIQVSLCRSNRNQCLESELAVTWETKAEGKVDKIFCPSTLQPTDKYCVTVNAWLQGKTTLV